MTKIDKITLIELKARDRATLMAMAKRYGVNHLIDFLEGIVMKEQGPTIVARFYDDPPENDAYLLPKMVTDTD